MLVGLTSDNKDAGDMPRNKNETGPAIYCQGDRLVCILTGDVEAFANHAMGPNYWPVWRHASLVSSLGSTRSFPYQAKLPISSPVIICLGLDARALRMKYTFIHYNGRAYVNEGNCFLIHGLHRRNRTFLRLLATIMYLKRGLVAPANAFVRDHAWTS